MKLVYTHENGILVSHVKNLLELAGIEIEMRNQFAGGANGELPVFHTWPEIWLVNETDLARAEALIQQLDAQAGGEPWTCTQCGEINEPEFDFCWRCQTQQPTAIGNDS